MEKYIIALITSLLLIAAVLFLPDLVYAQPPELPAKPDQTPIDGGLGLLAAAGGAYAVKKLRDKQQH